MKIKKKYTLTLVVVNGIFRSNNEDYWRISEVLIFLSYFSVEIGHLLEAGVNGTFVIELFITVTAFKIFLVLLIP